MQTCLEKRGITERNTEIVRNDYNREDEYSSKHKDALSDGDVQGKGTGSAGHGFWLPDCTKPTGQIDKSNFDTDNGGGLYDIEGRNGIGGRNYLKTIRLYNENYEYGPNLVNTDENVALGQYYTK